MTHDTDPTRTEGDTEPLADTTRRAAGAGLAIGADRPAGSATEPGSPPELDTSPDRPALAYGVELDDPEVAALLGQLAPARVPPAVGDTRETNGHTAAAFVVPLRSPPKAFDTPPPAPPVLVETSPIHAVTHGAAPRTVLPRTRPVDVTTVPRAQPLAPHTPKLVAGLAAGVLLTTVGVLTWFGVTSRAEQPSSTALPSSPSMAASAATVATPADSARPFETPSATTTPSASAATGESPHRIAAPASSRPAIATARAAGSLPYSPASASAAKAPPRLPDDIRWTVE